MDSHKVFIAVRYLFGGVLLLAIPFADWTGHADSILVIGLAGLLILPRTHDPVKMLEGSDIWLLLAGMVLLMVGLSL